MRFYIVIPAHNEEAYLEKTLQSLVEQTLLPSKIMVVNDHSTDATQTIIDGFSKKHPFIEGTTIVSEAGHAPGSKVVNAFHNGLQKLDEAYDVICKFDADLIFPKDYLEEIAKTFKENENCGMAGGFCYIKKNDTWILENLTNKDHIRGALKAYRKKCFETIGGLKNAMGWDTIDELLAKYHGWDVMTNPKLQVKHLKPTGKTYTKAAKYKQGEAFYKMRYGFLLTRIASLKLALKKNSFSYYVHCIQGYNRAKNSNVTPIVSEEEGKFIRKLRWKNIKSKLF